MTVTVNRSDISIREQIEAGAYSTLGVAPRRIIWWKATLDGRLSTKEYVTMHRTADTPREALTALEAAIAEHDWTIKENA